MKVKRSFDTDNYGGACMVLTNYLDGALADYENGNIDDDCTTCIEHSINALELMSVSIFGVGTYDEYRERFNKAKLKRKNEED